MTIIKLIKSHTVKRCDCWETCSETHFQILFSVCMRLRRYFNWNPTVETRLRTLCRFPVDTNVPVEACAAETHIHALCLHGHCFDCNVSAGLKCYHCFTWNVYYRDTRSHSVLTHIHTLFWHAFMFWTDTHTHSELTHIHTLYWHTFTLFWLCCSSWREVTALFP